MISNYLNFNFNHTKGKHNPFGCLPFESILVFIVHQTICQKWNQKAIENPIIYKTDIIMWLKFSQPNDFS